MSSRKRKNARGAPAQAEASGLEAPAAPAPHENAPPQVAGFSVGRTFLHPAVDVLAIGGGLSLVTALAVWLIAGRTSVDTYVAVSFPVLFLLSNSAHFAASTVRLYTKPGAFRALPFLTMIFPLLSIAAVTASIVFAEQLGPHLNKLYLTWSPYHYSMQAYGLSLMYCYRSGCQPSVGQKRLLLAACLMTFALTFINTPAMGAGLWWVASWKTVSSNAAAYSAWQVAGKVLSGAAFALPLAAFAWIHRSSKSGMPLIGMLIVLTNAIWFVLFPFINALSYATIFHGIQYLAIVGIFHVKDQMAEPGNTHGAAFHAAKFYAMCLALGYGLFGCLPSAYRALGFDYSESVLLVTAAINLHHFIVDGYIWKLKKDPNYKIVTDAVAAQA